MRDLGESWERSGKKAGGDLGESREKAGRGLWKGWGRGSLRKPKGTTDRKIETNKLQQPRVVLRDRKGDPRHGESKLEAYGKTEAQQAGLREWW